MMEVVISRVLVDYVIVGEQDSMMPDFGLIALTESLSVATAYPRYGSQASCFSRS